MLLLQKLTGIIFPQTCGACGVAMDEPGLSLCWDCRSSLAIISAPFCSLCGEPVHGSIDHAYICHTCTKHPPDYRHARAAIHYNDAGKKLVIQFKYNHALWLQPLLVELMASAVQAHYGDEAYDGIVAVPLHPVKQRDRGYNQSDLLAQALGRRLGVPMMGRRALRRIRATPSQTRLTARQRLTNVQGAFAVRRSNDWTDKRILLVDDVMTTGATVSACARVIRDAGARWVDVITAARGM